MTDNHWNSWTLKSLKEYTDAMLAEREARYLDKFAAKEELGRVQQAATDKALELAASTIEARLRPLEKELKELREHVDVRAGQQMGIKTIVGYVVGAIGIIVAVVSFLFGNG